MLLGWTKPQQICGDFATAAKHTLLDALRSDIVYATQVVNLQFLECRHEDHLLQACCTLAARLETLQQYHYSHP